MSEAAGLSAKHEQQCSGSHNEPDCITTELCLIIHSQRGRGRGGQREREKQERERKEKLSRVTMCHRYLLRGMSD